jgi:hypothetical protein
MGVNSKNYGGFLRLPAFQPAVRRAAQRPQTVSAFLQRFKRFFCPIAEGTPDQRYAIVGQKLNTVQPSNHHFNGTDGLVVIGCDLLCFPARFFLFDSALLFGLLQPALLGANETASVLKLPPEFGSAFDVRFRPGARRRRPLSGRVSLLCDVVMVTAGVDVEFGRVSPCFDCTDGGAGFSSVFILDFVRSALLHVSPKGAKS